MILGEVQDSVVMLDNGGNTIPLPPLGGLSDEVPPVLPFFFFVERLVVVQVNDGEISDGLGCDGDRDRCIGDGGRHRLSYGRDEAPEDIRRDGRSLCVFISVALISSRPRCHFLLGHNAAGSDKLG